MNCLAYALRFWKKDSRYRLYYDSGHVINSRYELHDPRYHVPGEYLPAESYGYDYFLNAFTDLLNQEEKELLKDYFKIT